MPTPSGIDFSIVGGQERWKELIINKEDPHNLFHNYHVSHAGQKTKCSLIFW